MREKAASNHRGRLFYALQRSLPTAPRFRMGRGALPGVTSPVDFTPGYYLFRTSGAFLSVSLLSYPFEMTFCSPRVLPGLTRHPILSRFMWQHALAGQCPQ